jgi:hypothetical protein
MQDGIQTPSNPSQLKPEKASTQIASVGFEVAEYDHSQPLVIDPVLVYSTYLGGNKYEGGWGIAIDVDGNAYIAGGTTSTNFPVTQAPFQPTIAGEETDAFIAKLSPDGSTLLSEIVNVVVASTVKSGFPLKPGHLTISEGYELRDLGSFEQVEALPFVQATRKTTPGIRFRISDSLPLSHLHV